jgi:hypothetical protein
MLSACQSSCTARCLRACAVALIPFLSIVHAKAVAADRPASSDALRMHPNAGIKSPLRADPRVKTCRAHRKEHRTSGHVEAGALDQQTAPLLLDAVMYFSPESRAGASGDGSGKPAAPGHYDRRGAGRELGVIDACMTSPRYY